MRHEAARRAAQRRARAFLPPTPDEARIEKAFLADLAPPDLLMRALHCAETHGVAALDALITCTAIDPETVTARLGRRLGVPVLERIDFPPDQISAEGASAAVQSGVLRLRDGRFIVAARGRPAIELARFTESRPGQNTRMRLASPAMFLASVLHAAGAALADEILQGPERLDPLLSAHTRGLARFCVLGALSLGIAGIAAMLFAPMALHAGLGAVFGMLTVLRLLGAQRERPERPLPRQPDDFLPVYTVLVPLYRESACISELVESLGALDYPQSKLDIKILVEETDRETLDTLQRSLLPNHFEIVRVPEGGPRTKPQALNAGLALARGSLIAVYDAEDRPDPGQLRDAANVFQRSSARLGCIQARLAIDNVSDNWMTRVFALEYAGLFDALLPALSRNGLFFPLGGTSNHFRTSALDRIGGWDAWNVTEDADLGARLTRMGYEMRVIASSTLEEAPNMTRAWLYQRTRWLKGYMLTWAVHMRRPRRLYRELGFLNFFAFQAFIGGVPASALILPIFVVSVASHILTGVWLSPDSAIFMLDTFNLVLGFGTAMALAAIGADRRRLGHLTPLILTVPLYWLMSSVAAWRAVWQLARRPYLWEKTEHGLARTSRSGRLPLRDSA